MREDRKITIAPGPGGWSQVTWETESTIYVRLALNADKKTVRITNVLIPDPTSELLRSVPLGRIETVANASGVIMFSFAAQYKQDPPADIPAWFRKARKTYEARVKQAARVTLERPRGRNLDDDFYLKVARAYSDAAAHSLNPRQALAKDSGAAPDTVARWTGEARRRGFLSKDNPGKVAGALTPKAIALVGRASGGGNG